MQTSIHREAVEWSYEQNKSKFPRQLQCYHGIKANQVTNAFSEWNLVF